MKYVLACVERSLFEHEEFTLSSVLSCYQVQFLSTPLKKIQQHLLSNNCWKFNFQSHVCSSKHSLKGYVSLQHMYVLCVSITLL